MYANKFQMHHLEVLEFEVDIVVDEATGAELTTKIKLDCVFQGLFGGSLGTPGAPSNCSWLQDLQVLSHP
ncbi:MAG: hypothetical protein ACRBEE_14950 [Arenicella sp.]